jgi:hypothetical protein
MQFGVLYAEIEYKRSWVRIFVGPIKKISDKIQQNRIIYDGICKIYSFQHNIKIGCDDFYWKDLHFRYLSVWSRLSIDV